MLFPTTDFAIFFAVVFTANWLLNPYPRSWKLFMIAASFLFYSWWDWHYVFLLAASTTIAMRRRRSVIDKFEGRQADCPRRVRSPGCSDCSAGSSTTRSSRSTSTT